MTTRRILVAIVVAGLLCMALVAGVAWRWAAPWVAWPDLHGDALDRQWAELVSKVATDPVCHGDLGVLTEAAALHAAVADEVDGRLWDEEDAMIPVAEFPPEAQRSGELLVAWAAADGGIASLLGTHTSGDLFPIFRVAQAAAASDDPERVLAALRFSRALRRCGPLVHGAVGVSLADTVHARQPDLFRDHPHLAPSADDVLAILHAEAVTADALLDLLDQEELQGGWETWLLDPERERAVLRAHWVQLLAGLPADNEAIVAALPASDAEDLPHSLLLRTTWYGVASVTKDLVNSVEAYE